MQVPDDFGYSPVATLAHVGSRVASWRHAAFWAAWEKAVSAWSPALREIKHSGADSTDPTATHQFESLGHAAIGGILVEPAPGTPVRAVLVALHGYERVGPLAGEPERWEGLAERGLATLAIRVRGFPGSTAGCGLLTDDPRGWVCHGLESLIASEDAPPSVQVASWVVPLAVADVVNAARAMRRRYGSQCPLFLHGESLGGGLAVMAAARGKRLAQVDRVAIGLPSLGDWEWRLGRGGAVPRVAGASGAGFHIGSAWLGHQSSPERFRAAIGIADAVVHAVEVRAPTLCKLAVRDDIVPAPSAAAVYNAIGTDPVAKWRFVTPYGHFDGGIRNARRHAIFDQVVELFLDPSRSAAESAAAFEGVLESGERLPEQAEGMLARRPSATRRGVDSPLFTAPGSGVPESDSPPAAGDAGVEEAVAVERRLCEAYRSAGRTLDDLPYTREFESIVMSVRAGGSVMTDRDVLHRLQTIRKSGRLPRLGRSGTAKPAVALEDETLLVELVEEAVGSLGHRDQLPYSDPFDRLVWRFNEKTGRSLGPHDVWRLVATLSK